jgi:2-phosphosulfolactate phosphatase
MKINKYDFVSGAQKAEGIVVIIDVFRAFTVGCYCFDQGVETLIPVGAFEEALLFESKTHPVVRIGERNGKKLPGFEFGNSPTEIQSARLDGKIVLQTTHAGTQGLVNACNASEVLTGALVNAKATAEYIKQRNPTTVSLVRMGFEAEQSTDEDDLCADYLESLLLGREFPESKIKETLRASPCAARFMDPEIPWNPISDFELCTDINQFKFVLKLEHAVKDMPYLTRVDVNY